MIARFLEVEKNAAFLLLSFALMGLAAANLGAADAIHKLSELRFGLTVHEWLGEVLLGGFFFLIGLELKRELTTGAFRNRLALVVPGLAALFGAAVPAAVFWLITQSDTTISKGWAIPMATDVTFALAVFSIFGTRWIPEARAFLLSFAVLDDLLAVLVIALFVGGGIQPAVLFAIAGLLVPSKLAPKLEGRLHPWVALVILPLFAFFAAAIPIQGGFAIGSALAIAILVRPLGKIIGITVGAWLGRLALGSKIKSQLGISHYLRISVLGGIGFTVALLIADLSYGAGSEATGVAKIATLIAAVVSMILGALALAIRSPKSN